MPSAKTALIYIKWSNMRLHEVFENVVATPIAVLVQRILRVKYKLKFGKAVSKHEMLWIQQACMNENLLDKLYRSIQKHNPQLIKRDSNIDAITAIGGEYAEAYNYLHDTRKEMDISYGTAEASEIDALLYPQSTTTHQSTSNPKVQKLATAYQANH